MNTAQFDYALPPERIAQEPLVERDMSRLLQVAASGTLTDHRFTQLPELLRSGDLLVANDTRVRRARLAALDPTGRAVEILVLQRIDAARYSCLVRPGRRARAGTALCIAGRLEAVVESDLDAHPGGRVVHFSAPAGDVEAAIEHVGTAPLPPYIHAALDDPERYQTVYACGAGASAAAPTAGLHFTTSVLGRLADRGIRWATVRLDVGLATFAPITTETVDAHVMHTEAFEVGEEAADLVNSARRSGSRVIAVGTTTTRVLETCAGSDGRIRPGRGDTSLFIRPGHRFRVVDGLITNFHQPRSSLLVLLAAFMGMDRWRVAYAHALAAEYRFLSFGDCMLCWQGTE